MMDSYTSEKEIFIETIIDLLITIDLDNVSESKAKEDKMRAELAKMDFDGLNDKYNQAYEIFTKNNKT